MADEGAALDDGETSAKSDEELGETMATAEDEVEEGEPGAPVQECEVVRSVYVRKVRGPERAKVGDTVRYEAYEFWIKEEDKLVGPEELCAAEKALVKWTVKINGVRHDRDETGDVLEFEVPETMGNTHLDEKTMNVHPYMNSPADHIVAPTYVYDGKLIIVIDPGHGDDFGNGVDSGAVGTVNGEIVAKEKDEALAVSKLLKEELMQLELVTEVHLTREGDLDDKVYPRLRWRIEAANQKGADYFISIHLDAFGKASANGYTMFHKSGHTEGKKLAEAMHDAYASTGLRSRGVKDKGLYVTSNFSGPSVLVELGFISNVSDRTYIMGNHAAIAQAIAQGTNDYLEAKMGSAE